MKYFGYNDTEINYLVSRDETLGDFIENVGIIKREIIPDLFECLFFNIVSQQISIKSATTIFNRINQRLGKITPALVWDIDSDSFKEMGVSYRKTEYLKKIARAVLDDSLCFNTLIELSDREIKNLLCKFSGIGEWTAEMTMIFCFQRKDILSFNDYGIKKGFKNLYQIDLTKENFEKYKRIYSPYATVASFYLWEAAKLDHGN